MQQSKMEQLSHPPTNFLSLPREIRDRIYSFALLASTCVVVWTGRWVCINKFDDQGVDVDGKTALEYRRIVDNKATASSIQHLALNLLCCNNTIVEREAAMTFYTNNTFSFLGDHNWDPIVSWLEAIGARNRGYITKLNVTARRPDQAWQRRDGTRVKIPNLREELYQRNPHLYRSPQSTEEGEVENINPAIETIFAILGSRDAWSTLKLQLLLDPNCLPGVELLDDDQSAYAQIFTMDLPNLIEKFRVAYTSQSENRGHVEVLWVGETLRHEFINKRSLIQKQGWEIVETREVETPRLWTPPPGHAPLGPILKVRFTLKRRVQTAVLVAEDPNPYSYLGYFD
ncbi:hypothetical protein BU24DRAFT_429503 [Aaosphaeria arxii CBS 175.79]|uniref:Uncharacterized protein n=1 Tax=Aaosphaeria arxii CBS 175.79 TaxID=1450172 RepID=A0A6A5X5T7_9PLEO|nr:uncharacterized protein BU24DRAFT_429503 [Aaosphaeria arxii CBS 175.79]KAF2008256.1 hypothetical protein BU24DRAFT_429503 [Aaosphaeria arxii CBS 175.79]